MPRVLLLDSLAHLPALPEGPVAPPDAGLWALTRPDGLVAVLDDAGALAARAALWWTDAPPLPDAPGVRTGAIGQYAAADDVSAAALLDAACAALEERGCAVALGPLDGSTWFRYRLVTDPAPDGSSEPPFALEPFSPPEDARRWSDADFQPVATYHSALAELAPDAPSGVERRLEERDVTLRPFDPGALDRELDALYGVSAESFAANPFFRPLDRARFDVLYRPQLALVRPELLLIAERDGEPLGYVFAYPDALRPRAGRPDDTVVVKTVAVRPSAQGLGLGHTLVARVERAAHGLGYRRAIHALMHDANRSVRISARDAARPIRRYALLARDLAR